MKHTRFGLTDVALLAVLEEHVALDKPPGAVRMELRHAQQFETARIQPGEDVTGQRPTAIKLLKLGLAVDRVDAIENALCSFQHLQLESLNIEFEQVDVRNALLDYVAGYGIDRHWNGGHCREVDPVNVRIEDHAVLQERAGLVVSTDMEIPLPALGSQSRGVDHDPIAEGNQGFLELRPRSILRLERMDTNPRLVRQ